MEARSRRAPIAVRESKHAQRAAHRARRRADEHPRLSRHADGYVRLDVDGCGYEVYDIVITDGRRRRARYGNAEATHRCFVMADRSYWSYAFTEGEDHALTPAALERQMDDGTYMTRPHVVVHPSTYLPSLYKEMLAMDGEDT